ncbi:hypothetical protein A2962_02465 [Candidatus Woesebacteria bacterium RIFCSPLOWO2_01_FULL_39_61]|uniref:ABC transporter permease n=2 Tax=Microgenomates group TaxID=1794810 RepID=A0A0H4T5C2_9BACT|nr:hypothetical protein [uncultured Microgenomates bacterium Rifle_16ft_4_minimus_37836]OGM25143.1 MAG: hypothetical protein A2692_01480 [Candidatus Woesebacteria bacterium RIFCSPHIGHO2_01_FULL_39_95]OGM34023.1 MAG: hypothetical protein A3D01_03770 [Candidatus Woesebacteria bacterium RIFCSPHIGHO2_02_FULL_39_13]OGM38281.1 MAG: hypothetical protein A3E13_05880 [Candidatus Woesebacteria bacterium RIFCSPHIGHO2_12_FULL_40_20]OGM66987.1 MAG: hypothetical protein A2962_02465 [Candidatus Woesebacteria 
MNKFLQIFKISFHQEFAYRINFIMWRVRNMFQIFLVFFLWDTIFANSQRIVFGYDRQKMLTYIFGLIIVRALVLSSKANEVGGDISRGDIINLLLKPISYVKYWLTRDLSSKGINLIFAVFETILLYFILRPDFFLQGNILLLLSFATSIVLAILIYFLLLFTIGLVPFWVPESAWGISFLMLVVVEFLSGALFPLDILPVSVQSIINFTPFPYLLFFPLQIYLGKVGTLIMLRGIGVSFLWLGVLWLLMRSVWFKGLKSYQAYGR